MLSIMPDKQFLMQNDLIKDLKQYKF